MQAIFHGSRFVGPAVAGLAIDRWGEASAFLLNGLSFLAVIASLLLIPPRHPAAAAPGAPQRGAGGIGAGFTYVWSDTALKRLLLLIVACMLFAFPFVVSLMAYYARYVVHADAAQMGRIMSASGLGAVIGSGILVLVGARGWRQRIGVGIVLVTFGVIGLGFARTPDVAALLVGTMAVGTSFYLGTITQVVQQRVPNEIRGRVMAIFMMGMMLVMPLASFGLAAVADVVGIDRLLVGCGVAFGITTTVLALTLPREAAVPASGVSPTS